jgi:hypothetical protein
VAGSLSLQWVDSLLGLDRVGRTRLLVYANFRRPDVLRLATEPRVTQAEAEQKCCASKVRWPANGVANAGRYHGRQPVSLDELRLVPLRRSAPLGVRTIPGSSRLQTEAWSCAPAQGLRVELVERQVVRRRGGTARRRKSVSLWRASLVTAGHSATSNVRRSRCYRRLTAHRQLSSAQAVPLIRLPSTVPENGSV